MQAQTPESHGKGRELEWRRRWQEGNEGERKTETMWTAVAAVVVVEAAVQVVVSLSEVEVVASQSSEEEEEEEQARPGNDSATARGTSARAPDQVVDDDVHSPSTVLDCSLAASATSQEWAEILGAGEQAEHMKRTGWLMREENECWTVGEETPREGFGGVAEPQKQDVGVGC